MRPFDSFFHNRCRLRRLALALGMIAGARTLDAQVVRGVIRDSVTGAPVPGAIVILLDSAGRGMTRNLSNERGLYGARRLAQARGVRVIRLGFRPRELPLPAAGGDVQLDVIVQSIPMLLATRTIEAGRHCPRRSDRAAALALLEQARAGLLATIVARSEQPARMTRLVYRRTLDAASNQPTRQTVRLDSTVEADVSFGAVQGAGAFVRQGFMRDSAGSQVFLAPDAETLLDDDFASGYCFHVMPADRARPNEVGLGFRPGGGRRPPIEIEGALWVDTVARALDDIEFRYVGLDERVAALRPGGRVAFRDMGNGTALVDSWSLRLVGAHVDSNAHASSSQRLIGPASRSYVLVAQESGGELARAVWPGGHAWDATLGTLHARAVRSDGAPAAGAVIGLDDTDYRATADSTGLVVIPQLVPGPYRAVVLAPQLAPLGVALYTTTAFTAARGGVVDGTIVVPTPEDFVAARCVADRRFAPSESVWLVGRVLRRDGTPVAGVGISFAEVDGLTERVLPWTYQTGTDGLFQLCVGLRAGMNVRVRATRSKGVAVDVAVRLDSALTVVPVGWTDR